MRRVCVGVGVLTKYLYSLDVWTLDVGCWQTSLKSKSKCSYYSNEFDVAVMTILMPIEQQRRIFHISTRSAFSPSLSLSPTRLSLSLSREPQRPKRVHGRIPNMLRTTLLGDIFIHLFLAHSAVGSGYELCSAALGSIKMRIQKRNMISAFTLSSGAISSILDGWKRSEVEAGRGVYSCLLYD